jgi:hypothetical protein
MRWRIDRARGSRSGKRRDRAGAEKRRPPLHVRPLPVWKCQTNQGAPFAPTGVATQAKNVGWTTDRKRKASGMASILLTSLSKTGIKQKLQNQREPYGT